MKITFYGHACFGIEINGKSLLLDPFITGNPLAEEININTIKADYILLTHAHQDHILDVEPIAERTGATIISNYEITMHYKSKGFNGFPVNHGGIFKTDEFSAKYVNAIHTSTFPDGIHGGQPGGFVITANDKSIYISGDTAVTMDMRLIPMQTKLSASIFPIGGTFTMGVNDAILASDLVECDTVIGCHFNTFEPIMINVEKVQEKFEKANKKLIILEIGQTIVL